MEVLAKVLGVVMLVVAMVIIFTLPIMWGWNGVMPIIFKLPELTFGQAFWLSVLVSSLFKPNLQK